MTNGLTWIREFINTHRSSTWFNVLLFWAGFASLLALLNPVSAFFNPPWSGAVLGVVVSLGALYLSILLLRNLNLQKKDIGIQLSKTSTRKFTFGFGVGLVLIVLHFGILWLFGGEVTLERVAGNGALAIVGALCSFIPLAIMEEIGFRGLPFFRLQKTYNLWLAQGIVAVAFALYHIAGGFPLIPAILGTGVGSLLFGMAAMASKELALPTGLHAAWNIGGWALGEKDFPGLWNIIIPESSATSAQIAGSLSYFGVMGLGILVFWIMYQKEKRLIPADH